MMKAAWHWIIAYTFATASAASASLFGFMSSTGPYAWIKAIVLALIAFGGCHGLGWAAKLRRSYGLPAAAAVMMATFLSLGVAIWGGLGTLASGSEELKAERKAIAEQIKRDKDDLKRVRDKIDAIGAVKPSSVLKAQRDRYNERSNAWAALNADYLRAVEAEKLEGQAGEINARLAKSPPVLEADPEAAAFSRIFNVDIEVSAALKALTTSVALELLGMVAFLVAIAERDGGSVSPPPQSIRAETQGAPQAEQRIQPPRLVASNQEPKKTRVLPPPQATAGKAFGSVKKFLASNLQPSKSERIAMTAVWARYKEWCAENKLGCADIEKFMDDAQVFAESAGYDIALDGTKTYCYGATLAA